MKRILLAIITATVCFLAQAESDPKLPEFGSSAGQLLSPEQEKRIGQSLLRELRGQGAVLDDPLLEDYLADLGFRLVAASDKPTPDFVFFVVRSTQINAFAAPGGYIGVHTGLITMTESENELAAVLGHEIAHVNQHHLVRAYERIQNATLPIALAILGALIATKGGSGDAAQAAVVGGAALLQQKAIDFTRDNESEADRVGISTLARAGFEPQAMAGVFGRMERTLRSNGSETPEFLRTHPINATRISEAKARATALEKDLALRKPVRNTDMDFRLFRERARVLGTDSTVDLALALRKNIEQDPEHSGDPEHYGLALALIRQNRPAEAIALLRPLLQNKSHPTAFDLAMAEAEVAAQQTGAALERLTVLARNFPDNRAVQLAYADQLVQGGKSDEAVRAMKALRPLLDRNADDAALQLSYARASELAGDVVRAGEAHAEVALLNGRLLDALGQLNDLLKREDVDYYQRARIEARIAEVTPYALEEKRHRKREDEDGSKVTLQFGADSGPG